MKRISKVLLIVVLLVAMIVPMASAQEQNIVEIAVEDGRFSTLIAAATAAGLADTLQGGEWTVFAPTDDAFAKLGLNADNVATEFSAAELTDILLYHVLEGDVGLDKAKTKLGDITMANGALAGLKFFDDSLWVNDDSRVIIPDILAENGRVHVVDTVILGPWPRPADDMVVEEMADDMVADEMMDETAADDMAGEDMADEDVADTAEPAVPTLNPNSIAGIAVNDGRFTTLVAAAQAAGLVDALNGGEWTVFAPTDDAFAKLGVDASNVADTFSTEELTDILLYHTLDSSVSSDKAKTKLGDVTMANGQLAGLKFFDDSLWVNDDSRVIIADILADNGYIHVVDTVILGPWPR